MGVASNHDLLLPGVRRQIVHGLFTTSRASEEKARGDAALVIGRGKAEAEALRRIVEAFSVAGGTAREFLVLPRVISLLGQIAGAARPLRVDKVAVLPGGSNETGNGAARAAIRSEQIRSSMGVDLTAIAKRLQGPAEATATDQPK